MAEPSSSENDSPWAWGYSTPQVRHALRYIVVAWVFGAAFFAITTGATFASFLKNYLRVDDLHYGLIMAAGPAASVFWFLGSYVVERTGRSKPVFLWFVSGHRLVWLVVAALPLLLRYGSRQAAAQVVVLVAFLSAAAASFGGVGWWTWMSTIVPKPLAGRYFGQRARLGLLSMLVASVSASFLIDRCAGRGWIYAVIFAVAAVLGAVDIFLFVPIAEVQRPSPLGRLGLWTVLATPWRDARFRVWSLYVTLTWMSYAMFGSFVWPFCFARPAEQGLGLSVLQTTALIMVLPQLMMAWVSPAWGRAIDRFGPKSVLRAGSLAVIGIPTLWLVIHRPASPGAWDWTWLLPVVAALTGLSAPGIDQALFYVQLREFPETLRTSYTASFQVVVGLATVLGTTLGGVCATFWRANLDLLPWRPAWLSPYHVVFATALCLRMAAFGLLFARLPWSGRLGSRAVFPAVVRDLLGAGLTQECADGGRKPLHAGWRRREDV
jgi:MFS family permease